MLGEPHILVLIYEGNVCTNGDSYRTVLKHNATNISVSS